MPIVNNTHVFSKAGTKVQHNSTQIFINKTRSMDIITYVNAYYNKGVSCTPGLMGSVSSPPLLSSPSPSSSSSPLAIRTWLYSLPSTVSLLELSAPLRTYDMSFFVRSPCKTPRLVKRMYLRPNFWKYVAVNCIVDRPGRVIGVWSIQGRRSSVDWGSARGWCAKNTSVSGGRFRGARVETCRLYMSSPRDIYPRRMALRRSEITGNPR